MRNAKLMLLAAITGLALIVSTIIVARNANVISDRAQRVEADEHITCLIQYHELRSGQELSLAMLSVRHLLSLTPEHAERTPEVLSVIAGIYKHLDEYQRLAATIVPARSCQ